MCVKQQLLEWRGNGIAQLTSMQPISFPIKGGRSCPCFLLWPFLAHCKFQNDAGKLPLGWLAGVGPVSTSTLERGIVNVVGDPPERSIWYLGWGKGWILDPEAGCSTFSKRHLWL